MAGSVNKVILVGNVGKDPEIRRTQDGKAIANLTLATSESWRDKATGDRKEKTEWHRIVIFNEAIAKVVEQYVKKGAKLYVEGALQTRKWTDKDGAIATSTEIVVQGFNSSVQMLGERKDGNGADDDREPAEPKEKFGSKPVAPRRSVQQDLDDEIPFAPEWR